MYGREISDQIYESHLRFSSLSQLLDSITKVIWCALACLFIFASNSKLLLDLDIILRIGLGKSAICVFLDLIDPLIEHFLVIS